MNEEEIMKNAEEIYCYGGTKLDEACQQLMSYKKENKNVYISFNGQKLYSLIDSLDDCYKKVTGMTKAEFEEAKKQWLIEQKKKELEEELEAIEKIPERIERGKKVISTTLHKKWEEIVKTKTFSIYHGQELDKALDILEALHENSFEKAYSLFKGEGHRGTSSYAVLSIILPFSEKGKEFEKWINENEPNNEDA